MTLRERIRKELEGALGRAGLPQEAGEVVPTAEERFGDYQTNCAMVIGKAKRERPREVAGRILESWDDGSEVVFRPEVAGAGFLNFRVREGAIVGVLKEALRDERFGVGLAGRRMRIVIDFSSPNVAKPMHVGHIRSTILGDSLARIARFLGHEVITDNHLGDWGTQFGKVIYGWKKMLNREALEREPVAELLRLYREVNALEERDAEVARGVREELVRLQKGEEENLAIWRQVVELTWAEFEKLYELLDVRFDERLGESFYNERLEPLVERLLKQGIASWSEGAVCVFFPEDKELADKPCLIRKRDGGFLYATTDLATLEYRMERWQPDEIWYVTGAPQALHFQQVFEVARRMGLEVNARHIAFGSILGEDRKIMKTRSGENVGLAEVLGEAMERARKIVREKNPGMREEEVEGIARAIGIGAVKYAELSQHRMTDYVFSWDKMLAFQGNTAPYLQNAYVRIRSMFRKVGMENEPEESLADYPLLLKMVEERQLALQLCKFGEIVPEVLDGFRPNHLCNYLYELANTFHGFYETCPVLKADEETRAGRMLLCAATAKAIRTGLNLLGIKCPEKM
ncbi:MAG: arginine--tRNA ligase [Chthoniobacterales bacterium]|nr:arginine--tRNA ligase [Chthoniobacterales bacterium]